MGLFDDLISKLSFLDDLAEFLDRAIEAGEELQQRVDKQQSELEVLLDELRELREQLGQLK